VLGYLGKTDNGKRKKTPLAIGDPGTRIGEAEVIYFYSLTSYFCLSFPHTN
jgi:hypothetical protein